MSDTLVFIPAWNEEDNLPAVLDALHADLPDADVLVIDDGSTDRTADVAREHGAEVQSLGTNLGLRFGIAAGYRYALEHGCRVRPCAATHTGRVPRNASRPRAPAVRLLGRR